VKSNALALICDWSVSTLGPTPYGRVWNGGTSACSLHRNPLLLHFLQQWCKIRIFCIIV